MLDWNNTNIKNVAKSLTIKQTSLNLREFLVERNHANVKNLHVFSIYILIDK